MATNKNSRDAMVTAAVVFTIAMTILVNILADRKFARIDLTKEQRYSVSAPFGRILDRLEGSMTMTYYISTQVPSWFDAPKRDILDKLKEIEMASRGKIKLEVIDPKDNKELVERLNKQGAQHQLDERKKDSVTRMLVFSSIEVVYSDKPKRLINPVGQAELIEYQIGSTILELTNTKKPIVAVAAPPAPPQNPMMARGGPQGSGFEWIWMNPEVWDDGMKFDVRNIDIAEGNGLPDNTALLVLVRPKEFTERQKYEVIRYLAGGGNVFLLSSPFKLSAEFGWRAEKSATNLEDYLKDIGVTFGADFVLDNSNIRLPYMKNGKMQNAKLPLFVKILADNVNQESVLTRLMPGLIMPSPAEIKFKPELLKKNNLKETVLAHTSMQSWSMGYMEAVDVEMLSNYDEQNQMYDGKKNVFVMVEGTFPFPYEGKPVPPWRKSAEAEPAKATELASVSGKSGRLIISSAPEAFHGLYLQDQQFGYFMQTNPKLLANIAESVSLGDELIQLRTKQYETRAINLLPGTDNDTKRFAIKMFLIIGIPLLVISFALIRAALRRDSQNRYERRFSATGPSSFTT